MCINYDGQTFTKQFTVWTTYKFKLRVGWTFLLKQAPDHLMLCFCLFVFSLQLRRMQEVLERIQEQMRQGHEDLPINWSVFRMRFHKLNMEETEVNVCF